MAKKNILKLISSFLSGSILIFFVYFPPGHYIAGERQFDHLSTLIDLSLIWGILLIAIASQVALMIDEQGGIFKTIHLADLISGLTLTCFFFWAVGRVLHFSYYIEVNQELLKNPGTSVIFDGKNSAYLNGEIGQKSVDTFVKLNEQAVIRFLELDSPGGIINSALEISKEVEQKNISVVVRETCASACVLIAVSGKRLFTLPQAQFGFHNALTIVQPESEIGKFASSSGSDLLFSFLKQHGVPNSIISEAKATPADDMFWVSGRQFIALGLANPID